MKHLLSTDDLIITDSINVEGTHYTDVNDDMKMSSY